jgi:hypothetical protein
VEEVVEDGSGFVPAAYTARPAAAAAAGPFLLDAPAAALALANPSPSPVYTFPGYHQIVAVFEPASGRLPPKTAEAVLTVTPLPTTVAWAMPPAIDVAKVDSVRAMLASARLIVGDETTQTHAGALSRRGLPPYAPVVDIYLVGVNGAREKVDAAFPLEERLLSDPGQLTISLGPGRR